MVDEASLKKELKTRFGYSEFRGFQLEAIQAVLEGHDTFVLMETGGGKSMCFTLPAILMPGVAMVVSPLIALMENQVNALKQRGIAAEAFNSTKKESERKLILKDLSSSKPKLKLLYITPESLQSDLVLAILQNLKKAGYLSFIAVDEAHCISTWGHDFRPAYRKLAKLKTQFGKDFPILALTATASAKVQEDIRTTLKLQDPVKLISSFDRPNIHFAVRALHEDSNTIQLIADDLEEQKTENEYPCAIIYARKKEMVDTIARTLSSDGIKCEAYHAGRKSSDRTRILASWTSGETPIVAATISFGMGIDKSNVRAVYHVNLPKNLESLYQEVGRAGRDGLPSKSIVYYKKKDEGIMTFLLGKGDENEMKRELGLQGFYKLVDYCTEDQCRRKTLLAHFGEKRSNSCTNCDVCLDDDGVLQRKMRNVLTEFRENEEKRKKKYNRRSNYEDSYGSYNFEIDSSPGNSEQASEDVSDLDSENIEASKIAREHKSQGTPAIFNALEKAESQAKILGSSTKRKRSTKLGEEDSAPKRINIGAPPVNDTIRKAATERFQKALQTSNPSCKNEESMQSFLSISKDLEQKCFSESGSKTVYLGKVAAMARNLSQQKYETPTKNKAVIVENNGEDFSGPEKRLREESKRKSVSKGQNCSSEFSVYQNEIDNETQIDQNPCRSEGRLDLLGNVGEINAETLDVLVLELENKDCSNKAIYKKISMLESFKTLKVSTSLLTHNDIGKRVKKISKHENKRLASQAKAVVNIWKEILLAKA